MAEYLSPEIYIEEVSSGLKPILGVGTSTTGFVGLCQKGPIGVAVPISNFGEFVRKFGTFVDWGCTAFAVRSFFAEGGTLCYVVRTCHYAGAPRKPTLGAAKCDVNDAQNKGKVLTFTASSGGSWGNDLSVSFRHLPDARFAVEVREAGSLVEVHDELSFEGSGPEDLETRINTHSERVKVQVTNSSLAAPARRPADRSTIFLDGGTDGLGVGDDPLNALDFEGDAEQATGFHAFDTLSGINLLAAPDGDRAVHAKGYAYCESRKDCFYIADCQQGAGSADEIVNYKRAQGPYSGQNALNSTYGALYAPWVGVFDPRTGRSIKIPPSGAVAGRFAGVDQSRGVHKAAAGVDDGRLLSVLDLEREFSDADQARLNPAGINLIRKFAGIGPVIWGARTSSTDPEWTYLNVRRFFVFVEQSVASATRWTVFEPNAPSLWKAVTLNVSAFLRQQWAAGALVGLKEEEAFYVKCDRETNPPESVDLGRVITEVGLAVAKPAEFVILRFTQLAGQA